MSYDFAADLSRIITLILFASILAGVFVFAFWPANKARFDNAARLPLASGADDQPKDTHNGRS